MTATMIGHASNTGVHGVEGPVYHGLTMRAKFQHVSYMTYEVTI